jgi:hypothetical protein
MDTAITQWEKLVKQYEDIDTKKNAGMCVIFGKPFFVKDRNGVYMRDAKGKIKIVSFFFKLIVYIKQFIFYCCI